MLEQLKAKVLRANLDLVTSGLVQHTWGNASGIDRAQGLVAIKPSGVAYDRLRAEDMVLLELASGRIVEGSLKPSSDTPTHLVLYRAFGAIGGIVHTHSLYATAWAQSGKEVPAFGTTHADHFLGGIPCTRPLTPVEITSDYEANTGKIIVEAFVSRDPMSCPAVLVPSHGPFTWGKDVADAVVNAEVLESVSRMASETLRIFPSAPPMPGVLMEKHFFRKHGAGAYYGQQPVAKPNANQSDRE